MRLSLYSRTTHFAYFIEIVSASTPFISRRIGHKEPNQYVPHNEKGGKRFEKSAELHRNVEY